MVRPKVLSVRRYTLNIFKVSPSFSLESVLESLTNNLAKSLTKSLASLEQNLKSDPLIDSN